MTATIKEILSMFAIVGYTGATLDIGPGSVNLLVHEACWVTYCTDRLRKLPAGPGPEAARIDALR